MKSFSHTRPLRDAVTNEIIGAYPAPVSRVTHKVLGGQFGSDKRKRLVVTLRAGDVIEIRPEKTRRVVSMTAVDIYRIMLRNEANKMTLEKARAAKVKKAERRIAARIARTDARLRKQSREERAAIARFESQIPGVIIT